ncbi:hypothetical protein [Candidatus Pelagibacter communis]|uniref:hypothetical protein n=1 Tax=Pelagibacter ubique TaxID=198252 RepID=UPI00094C4C46|nr:hypothetical protein [Candidatus Pelagibacter ubique]|tara:strand:+ start:1121 stop:1936 length:816 start_codon:yes stop_codon:yes gene_type:complete
MSRNLVLAAAVGYNFEQISLFLKSLRKYYSDEICIIIDGKDKDLEYKLKEYSCKTITTTLNKKKIQFKRYKIFSSFLENKNYDKILLSDSRDVYFQGDPFNYNYTGEINFFLEDYKIKDCPYNSKWIIKTYGNAEYLSVANNIILCSGTVLGKNEKIKEYLNLINHNIEKFNYKKRLKYYLTFRTDPEERGCDQGHANYLVYKNMISSVKFYSNKSGPFATVFYLKNLNFDNKLRLVNELQQPYLLVHQYDKRWEKFSGIFNEIKKKFESN